MKNSILLGVTVLCFIVSGCDSAHLDVPEEGPMAPSHIVLGSGTYHHRITFEDPGADYVSPSITSKKGNLTLDVGTPSGTCQADYIDIQVFRHGSSFFIWDSPDLRNHNGSAFNLDSYASAGDRFYFRVNRYISTGEGSSGVGCDIRVYFEGND